jgi:hypothetical protein
MAGLRVFDAVGIISPLGQTVTAGDINYAAACCPPFAARCSLKPGDGSFWCNGFCDNRRDARGCAFTSELFLLRQSNRPSAFALNV